MPTFSNKSIVLVFFKSACILINALNSLYGLCNNLFSRPSNWKICETCEVTQTIHIPTSTEWPNSKTPTLWLTPFLRTSSIISSVRQNFLKNSKHHHSEKSYESISLLIDDAKKDIEVEIIRNFLNLNNRYKQHVFWKDI